MKITVTLENHIVPDKKGSPVLKDVTFDIDPAKVQLQQLGEYACRVVYRFDDKVEIPLFGPFPVGFKQEPAPEATQKGSNKAAL